LYRGGHQRVKKRTESMLPHTGIPRRDGGRQGVGIGTLRTVLTQDTKKEKVLGKVKKGKEDLRVEEGKRTV